MCIPLILKKTHTKNRGPAVHLRASSFLPLGDLSFIIDYAYNKYTTHQVRSLTEYREVSLSQDSKHGWRYIRKVISCGLSK